MDNKATTMTRSRGRVTELGYRFAAEPETIYLHDSPTGGRYLYPDALSVSFGGWKHMIGSTVPP